MDTPLRRPELTTILACLTCFRVALAAVAGLAGVLAFLSGASASAALLWVAATGLTTYAVLAVATPSVALTDAEPPEDLSPNLSPARGEESASRPSRAGGGLGRLINRLAAGRPRRLSRRVACWQLPIDVTAISLLIYALGTAGGPLVLAYSIPVAVAALRSGQSGVVAAVGSAVGFGLARALGLIGLGFDLRPGAWPGSPAGNLLDLVASVAILSLALAGLALVLGSQGGAWRYVLTESSEDVRRWQEEARRQQASAAERSQAYGRLEKLLRSRSAPTLQVAHQLRAPVAAIQSCLDVVLQGYAGRSPEQQQRMLQSARDAAAEMLALTSDVLRLGELREATLAPRLELVDVREVATHVANAYRGEAILKSVQLTLHVAPGLPPICAKKVHLEELFRNLLDNAIKYNVPGGNVWLRLWLGDGVIRGEVGDTGIGIREKDLPRIFEEFYRADNAKEVVTRGTGLGLPIVKQVVELCGGTIQVHSKLGEGTTFTFSLPVPADGPATTVVRQDNRDGRDETG